MPPRPDPRVAAAAVIGAVGVAIYVGAWLTAGLVTPGFDQLRQAISETFALGAPLLPATLVRVALVLSGVGLVLFGWALERGLPGEGRAAPLVCAISGVLTVAVVAVPCTSGCPGAGASLLDTLHTVVAAGGYLALIATPLLVARRVRQHARSLARWSLILGGLALAGFLARAAGWEPLPGLQQRVFNTVADAWFVVAGVWLFRRHRGADAG